MPHPRCVPFGGYPPPRSVRRVASQTRPCVKCTSCQVYLTLSLFCVVRSVEPPVRCLFLVCCGTMLPLCYSVLLLCLMLPTLYAATCTRCFGEAPGCTGDTAKCPWSEAVSANVAALVAGSTLAIAALLPGKVCRLMTRPVLDAIVALAKRPASGVVELVSQTHKQVVALVKMGQVAKADAHLYISSTLLDAAYDAGSHKMGEMAMKAIESLPDTNFGHGSSVEGGIMFTLFTLSPAFSSAARGSLSINLNVCMPTDDTSSKDASKGTRSSFSARLIRPPTAISASALFNMFVAVLHATGLADTLASTMFLEEVYYEPVRNLTLEWQVGFECVVIYLRMLEAQGTTRSYTLSNIFYKSGGMDAVRAEALSEAITHHGPTFRTLGANPIETPTGGKKVGGGKDGKDEVYKGTVSECNTNSKMGCVAWNLGNGHLAKHVDTNGKCKFNHVCDAWVTDKGPRGSCGGTHKRGACTYDPAKKCNAPV